jgi:hypothetical protein
MGQLLESILEDTGPVGELRANSVVMTVRGPVMARSSVRREAFMLGWGKDTTVGGMGRCEQ